MKKHLTIAFVALLFFQLNTAFAFCQNIIKKSLIVEVVNIQNKYIENAIVKI